MIRAFIQARMSSARFPGKVLAPITGRPMLSCVVERVGHVVPRDRIVVATSVDATDDPLAAYAGTLGVQVFRGPLDDVFSRFQACLQAHPCRWFFRVCADSPALDPGILASLSARAHDGVDVLTNVHPRTFPRGQSAELLSAPTFASVDERALLPEEREHVTRFFYARPGQFRVVNLENPSPAAHGEGLAVDTLDDLRRVERWLELQPALS